MIHIYLEDNAGLELLELIVQISCIPMGKNGKILFSGMPPKLPVVSTTENQTILFLPFGVHAFLWETIIRGAIEEGGDMEKCGKPKKKVGVIPSSGEIFFFCGGSKENYSLISAGKTKINDV